MTEIIESSKIQGVKFVRPGVFGDARGRFMETFRKEWFAERSWDMLQTNRSDSQAGVLRGLHYHFKQVDYWFCIRGRIRVGMVDLRPTSPTYKQSETLDIGEENGFANLVGVFIPVGVAHGFYTISDATLTYVVDNYYNGADELGVAWDDPELAVEWRLDSGQTPILSPRDQQNPPLAKIPAEKLPK